MSNSSDYLLGVSQTELERLRFQHTVWGHITQDFFDRLKMNRGWKCLDVGAGPGFVAMNLRERVGEEGHVTLLEPSQYYLDWFSGESRKQGWTNITFINGTAETAHLPEKHFDLIFSRWVIGFVPDPEQFLERLVRSLRPGGLIAIQDYIYEGLSLFPRGGAFEGMADAVRAYWRSGGGDPNIAARIPIIFRKQGIRLIDYSPNVLSGGPESGVMEWAHRFFTTHIQSMVDKQIISQQRGDAMWKDWLDHRANPDTIFVSPIVFDIAGMLSS